MRYLLVADIAKKWNMSERSVRNYCAKGRVNGAFLTGKTWNIPENAEKPERTNKRKGKTMLKPISEIAPYVPFGKSKTTQLLKAMEKKGVIAVEGKGRGTKYIIK